MYKLTHTDIIIRLADNALIPCDQNNADYQQFLRWRDGYTDSDGIAHDPNTPEPASSVAVSEITMAQARLGLLHYNLLSTVDPVVNALGGAAQIEWEFRSTVHKNSELVRTVQQNLGWSDQQITEMFEFAATL